MVNLTSKCYVGVARCMVRIYWNDSMAAIRRIFSGIQPSGTVHLGNYLGALRSWVRLQDECPDVLYSIVDLHALTVPQAPTILRENVRHIASCLLACGVDPERSVLFQQSAVSQHCELTWLLACRTPVGWLNKMTQWKVWLRWAGYTSRDHHVPPTGQRSHR